MDILGCLLLIAPLAVFFGLGYLIRFRKAYWLISGYNTMSAEKKQKVDTEKLGILMGNMCFAIGLILSLGILLLYFQQPGIAFVVLFFIVPVIIYTIIAAQKYDGNTRDQSGQMKTSAKIIVGAIILFILATVGFAGVLVYQGFQPTKIAIDQQALTISGSYGRSIPFDEIQKIEWVEVLPKIQLRTNGSAIGDNLRGNFRLENIGQALLFINRSQPAFIYIETKSKKIFLNLETPELTQQLFSSLNSQTSCPVS